MSFIAENICSFKKITVIVVSGKEKNIASEMIRQVLSPRFKVKKTSEALPNSFDLVKNDVFIIETELSSKDFYDKIINFINFSEQAILINDFNGDNPDNATEITKSMNPGNFLIFNFDDLKSRKIGQGTKLKKYAFGFEQGADFRASDLRENGGTNYKINFQGKSIPVWQENFPGKEYIYASLCASSVATILGMNFVEISEALK